jgi:hypothetical protein
MTALTTGSGWSGDKRNSPHTTAVVILNIFFGVTLFGWIIALVLASKQPQPVVVVYNTPPPPR